MSQKMERFAKMPKITTQEAKKGCPYCREKPVHLRKRMLLNEETGKRDKFGGFYSSCRCYALTFSKRSGHNLANSLK